MVERFRCSVAAQAEPLAGTAPNDRAFLLIEHPAPWGRKALEESKVLPESVRVAIAERAAAAGVRVQLVRRHRAPQTPGGFRVFMAYVDPAAPWVGTAVFSAPEELLELSFDDLASGVPAPLEPHTEPLFLVCTNGRRDLCCAELGRPLVAAVDAEYPELTWETTHLGGHRFAGAMLVLPAGLSYGRVTETDGLRLARLALEGRLDPAFLRGRTAYPPAVQAAEVAVLSRLGADRIDTLELAGVEEDGDESRVTFTEADAKHSVLVTRVPGPAVRQSCADLVEKPTASFTVG